MGRRALTSIEAANMRIPSNRLIRQVRIRPGVAKPVTKEAAMQKPRPVNATVGLNAVSQPNMP